MIPQNGEEGISASGAWAYVVARGISVGGSLLKSAIIASSSVIDIADTGHGRLLGTLFFIRRMTRYGDVLNVARELWAWSSVLLRNELSSLRALNCMSQLIFMCGMMCTACIHP
jgi:hypothetical protein